MRTVDLRDMALSTSATRVRSMYLLGTLFEVLSSSNRWDYITTLIKYDLTTHWRRTSGKRALRRASSFSTVLIDHGAYQPAALLSDGERRTSPSNAPAIVDILNCKRERYNSCPNATIAWQDLTLR